MAESPHLVLAVTFQTSLGFLRGQVRAMVQRGYSVTVFSPEDAYGRAQVEEEGGRMVAIPFHREPAPFHDLRCLLALVGELRRIRPEVVNAGTPKAGLLVLLAATLTGVPNRVYTLRGLRFTSESGIRRWLFHSLERVAAACAHVVIGISPSLRDEAVTLGVAPASKIVVLSAGSSNGVDLAQFSPSEALDRRAAELRREHRIPPNAPVVLFVGRVARDKGIGELAEAWRSIAQTVPEAYLVLAGEFERPDLWPQVAHEVFGGGPRVVLLNRVADPAPWYAMSTLVVLPSWREGFGNVLAEANAMERPVVATDVAGCRDAVVHGRTGTLVPPRDSVSLAMAITAYLRDSELCRTHGQAGRVRVVEAFDSGVIWEAQAELYRRLRTRGRGRRA